jgi:hypothetical protein
VRCRPNAAHNVVRVFLYFRRAVLWVFSKVSEEPVASISDEDKLLKITISCLVRKSEKENKIMYKQR